MGTSLKYSCTAYWAEALRHAARARTARIMCFFIGMGFRVRIEIFQAKVARKERNSKRGGGFWTNLRDF